MTAPFLQNIIGSHSCALWRRLDAPGHDAAVLTRGQSGWTLRGAAVFLHEDGPAYVNYGVDLDLSWRTLRGQANGSVAGRAFAHVIVREPNCWRLDGAVIEGLEPLWDLDFGFTPATNLQQLRRSAPEIGQSIDLPVAWFDLGSATLTKLPQRYERRDEWSYWYEAPTVAYEGLLALSPSGFVSTYPGLWTLET